MNYDKYVEKKTTVVQPYNNGMNPIGLSIEEGIHPKINFSRTIICFAFFAVLFCASNLH